MTDADADPTARNRLADEESPYLRQHADNPVNWQPWDDLALEAARERDVPIFLSIGYSACHWCHVMADESFADEDVAEVLNENFVPIKVDREERPDLDSVYMSICQQVTGRGGWPLSVWLTPDGKPFFVGTYFPKEPARGMPAFPDLLENVADSWNDPDQREDVAERAAQWTAAIESDLASTPDSVGETPEESVLSLAADTAVRGADREHGGWGGGGGPKFPQAGRLHVLMRAFERDGRDAYRDVVEETLDAMAGGGLFDHVGGGFHRYCTDREWVVPHFEKMLYDNADIARVMLAGYQFTGDERYAEVARRAYDFVQREMTHVDGGFFSTLDAQSESVESGEHEEGTFYVWTPAEVHDVVDDQRAADLYCDRYGVTDRGNFDGANVLTISTSVEELAHEYELGEDEVEESLSAAREHLFDARERRPRPARDEKVLAGWNGMLISAFAEGAIVLDGDVALNGGAELDDSYADVATDALSFVREQLWDESGHTLQRRYKDGDVSIDGYLEDYAFLGRGAFDLYQATGDVEHLAFALDLAHAIEREFWDEDAGTLYFTPASGESLIARPQELTDQSTPSSAGVAVQFLLSADHFTNHGRFESIARRVLETHADRIEANPMEHASLVLAADRYSRGSFELTIAADGMGEKLPDVWCKTLSETYLPDRLVARRPATDDGLAPWLKLLGLDETPPIWAGRRHRDGEPTVYACRNFTCSPPQHSLGDALSWSVSDDQRPP